MKVKTIIISVFLLLLTIGVQAKNVPNTGSADFEKAAEQLLHKLSVGLATLWHSIHALYGSLTMSYLQRSHKTAPISPQEQQ